MIVVSDSTPLISLMKASQLDILKKLFGDVLIPEAAFSELTTNDAFPKKRRSFERVRSLRWLQSAIIKQFLCFSVRLGLIAEKAKLSFMRMIPMLIYC